MTRRPWTEKEDLFLVNNYEMLSNDEIANELKRSMSSVRNRRVILNLIKTKRKRSIYEVVKGYEVIATGSAEECAEKLGLKKETIYWYASSTYQSERAKDESILVFKLDDDEIEAM